MPNCAGPFDIDEVLFACPSCGALLVVAYDWSRAEMPRSLKHFDSRRGSVGGEGAARADFSGVWRFREMLPFASLADLVTLGEGRTILCCGGKRWITGRPRSKCVAILTLA